MSTHVQRRPILGFFAGLFLGLGVALVLFVFGVLPTTVVWLAILSGVGVVLGVVAASTAPARGR
ncbi:hypothetical protein [Actinotalea sp.]|uniref:hypothetical protein n=1 Tax=Actinotalea sp. TaxID=1872145 RepID=UPI00356838F2